jgi:hypothetical protein
MADTPEQRPKTEASRLRLRVLAMLTTPTGLRQAFFMAEILGPSLARRKIRANALKGTISSSSTTNKAGRLGGASDSSTRPSKEGST